MADRKRTTTSGIDIPAVLCRKDAPVTDEQMGLPGKYPFTRGVYREMYRQRPWTMRQYAGFGTAEETNRRFKYLLDKGQTGLSVAFDLATQIGYDSDHPLARGEVGRTGVAIDTLEDMERLFEGIPLDEVSTSMTINAPAAILLAMYVAVGHRQGVSPDKLQGTIQNDVLKEFIARGTYILPPRPSMRIVTDIFAYAGKHLPRFNTISISGYHIREAGATAVQEVAFTLANGIAYVEAAKQAGLSIDDFAPRLSFFFAAHNDLFEEVAKFRTARRIWARIMKEGFGAKDERSMLLRFHTQTGGSTLTAQQPENNIVRTTLQALAAALGGTQSLHTNSYDEALALPTEKAAEIALRTQQILAHESGLTNTVDPLAGSYFVEYLGARLEEKINAELEEVERLGGAVRCIETGYFRDAIAQSAYQHQRRVESGETIVVGVNEFKSDRVEIPPVLKIDSALEARQIERLRQLRNKRDAARVTRNLARLEEASRGEDNVMPVLIEAVEACATIGEISDTFRKIWGEYHDNR